MTFLSKDFFSSKNFYKLQFVDENHIMKVDSSIIDKLDCGYAFIKKHYMHLRKMFKDFKEEVNVTR
jgi:hypothetical protein